MQICFEKLHQQKTKSIIIKWEYMYKYNWKLGINISARRNKSVLAKRYLIQLIKRLSKWLFPNTLWRNIFHRLWESNIHDNYVTKVFNKWNTHTSWWILEKNISIVKFVAKLSTEIVTLKVTCWYTLLKEKYLSVKFVVMVLITVVAWRGTWLYTLEKTPIPVQTARKPSLMAVP